MKIVQRIIGGMTVLLVLGCFVISASAQDPIDPLLRPRDEKGKLQYQFGWHVRPDVVALAPPGSEPVLSNQYAVTVHGGLQYGLTRRLDATVTGQLEAPWWQHVSASPSSPARGMTDTTFTGSVGIGWRVAPEHPWAPVVSMERLLGGREQWAAALTGQHIADPIVVSSGLTVHGTPREGMGSQRGERVRQRPVFGFVTGFTFVFNDEYSGSANVMHRLPVSGQPGALTSLAFGLHRNVGFDGKGIDYELRFTERWGNVHVRFGMTWRGASFRFAGTSMGPDEG